MNSQRLEEIVAELMKPISDARRSFDTDLSALLEEYLTEAGLHALEQEDAGAELVPNFAELALLLQQSANIYGRKVDCLHACVLSVCEALHAASELGNTSVAEAEAEAAQGGGRRSAGGARAEFAHIALRACAGAAREAGGARPPPTLPRQFAELQPRPATGAPLTDLAGDHIGFPADYYVLCRLQDGMLLEDLEEVEQVRSAGSEPAPALLELQAALAARGPSGPGPPAFSSPPLSKPPPSSPPPTPPPVPCATSTPLPPPAPPSLLLDSLFKKRRKRQSDERIENIAGTSIKMMMMRAAARLAQGAPRDLAGHVEQGAPRWEEGAPRWEHVARARAAAILRLRRRKPAPETGFKGFDFASPEDIGGFPGWSAAAAEQAEEALGRSAGSESEDDGFFEQSSVSESESLGGGARHEAVRAVAARVLAALAGRSRPTPLPAVLAAAHHHRDVSSLFLATLFLANAGNVEIIPGAALSLGACSLRLLSTDHALYCAAARDHLHLDI